MEFLSTRKDGAVVLFLNIQPRASHTRICGIHDGALKLAVTASPTDGKANKAVVDFLASFFKLPKRKITLVSGLQSRKKRCVIEGMTIKEVHRSLQDKI